MPRRSAIAAAACSLVLLFAACGDDDDGAADPEVGAAAPAAARVDIEDFSFGPDALAVSPGAEVTFVNADSAAHTATSRDTGLFTTESIDGSGGSVTVTAPTEAGTYEYFCAFHPTMVAAITVS